LAHQANEDAQLPSNNNTTVISNSATTSPTKPNPNDHVACPSAKVTEQGDPVARPQVEVTVEDVEEGEEEGDDGNSVAGDSVDGEFTDFACKLIDGIAGAEKVGNRELHSVVGHPGAIS
jgi:hypothetical protein